MVSLKMALDNAGSYNLDMVYRFSKFIKDHGQV